MIRHLPHFICALFCAQISGCTNPSDLAPYGTLTCKPTDAELNQFYAPLPSQTQSAAVGLSSCVSCHANTASNSVHSGFRFADPPNLTSAITTTTPADERSIKIDHFCYTYFWGNRIAAFAPLVVHSGYSTAAGAGWNGLTAWLSQLK